MNGSIIDTILAASGITQTHMYEHDVFLSYPADSAAGKWVLNHFLPVLREELDAAGPATSVFCWTENETGVIWDLRLRRAHARSKVMVAVLTPPYFHKSHWCPVEWHTMAERERLARENSQLDMAESLICPVLFSDGDHLPAEARSVTVKDFRNFAFPEPVFRDTANFLSFRQKVRELADEIVNHRLMLAPAWSENWPVIKSPSTPSPRAQKPSFA